MFVSAIFTTTFLCSSMLSAQELKTSPISVALVGGPQDAEREVSAINVSNKHIVAYSILFEYVRNDKVVFREVHAGGRGEFLIDGQWNDWMPNKVVRLPKTNAPMGPAGVPLEPRIVVDWVQFSDGSRWGPQSHPESFRAQGQAEGVQRYRMHLREMLNRKGAEAVLEQIRAERRD